MFNISRVTDDKFEVSRFRLLAEFVFIMSTELSI